jgi:hypothetical protein
MSIVIVVRDNPVSVCYQPYVFSVRQINRHGIYQPVGIVARCPYSEIEEFHQPHAEFFQAHSVFEDAVYLLEYSAVHVIGKAPVSMLHVVVIFSVDAIFDHSSIFKIPLITKRTMFQVVHFFYHLGTILYISIFVLAILYRIWLLVFLYRSLIPLWVFSFYLVMQSLVFAVLVQPPTWIVFLVSGLFHTLYIGFVSLLLTHYNN